MSKNAEVVLGKKDWSFHLARLYTSGLGLGFLPKAPGTFGSLPGLALGAWLYTLHIYWSLCILLILSWIGIAAIRKVEQKLDAHDPSEIVIDEILGQAIAVLLISPSWMGLIISFVLFRILDIWKPGPIGWVDQNVPKAIGTMADDIAAGLLAGFIGLMAVKYLI